MKRVFRILIPVGVVILVLAVAGVYAASQPLSKGLSVTLPAAPKLLPTDQPQPTQTRPPEKTQATQLQAVVPTTTTLPAIGSGCGKGSTSILVLGESNPDPGEKRGADAIRLVTINFDEKKVTVLSYPANLVVRTIGQENVTLTLIYYQVKTTAKGDDKARTLAATNALAQAFADHFSIVPDHYITVNEQVFSSVVDTLGGINLNVLSDVDGTADDKGYFKAGEYVFTGATALDYVRIINPGKGDSTLEGGRLQRQNDVLRAIFEKAQKPENWTKIPQLLEQFQGNITTDLSFKQMLEFACLYRDPALQVMMPLNP